MSTDPTDRLLAVETNGDGDRFYTWDDGARYPSVTTITNADPDKQKAIENWRNIHPNPDEYRDSRAVLGTAVHHRILNPLAIRELPAPDLDMSYVDDEMKAKVDTAVAMWDTLNYSVGNSPYVEMPVRHDEYEYAGRFDLLTDDGTLIDLKTSPSVHDSYKMQVAAYAKTAARMESLPPVERGAIVSLNPDIETNPRLAPRITELDRPALDRWFDKFLKVLTLYRK